MAFYEVTWYTDSKGNKISIEHNNEPYKIADGKIVLSDIPDSYFKVQINGFNEVPLTAQITQPAQYKVNYDTSEIFFDSTQEGQTIMITKYYGRGRVKLYGQNIKLDNSNGTYISDNIQSFATEIFNRVDNIVSNAGSSNIEIVDARNDSTKNITYNTVKHRLDTQSSEISTKVNKQDISIFVSDYKTSSNTWQNALQAALNYVNTVGGGTVILPKRTIVTCDKVGEKDTNATTLTGYTQKHSYCIDIGSNTSIDLNESTIKLNNNQNASLFVTMNMIVGDQPASENISIFNGTFDMNCQNQTNPTTSTMDAITFFNLVGLKLYNIRYKNIRTSSFKLLAVKNFNIDKQYTSYSDGDAYRLGILFPDHPYELRCEDGVIGVLEAENCMINKNGTLQGNPIIASIKNTHIEMLRAKSCGGGFKFQDGCENINIGKAIFNGAISKDIYNSSNNSGFKVQGGSNANPCNITIGEIISTDCEGEGLYVEATNNISIGRYIGINNGTSGVRSDVRLGNSKRLQVSSISSTKAGSSGVELRSDLFDSQIGIINVLNPAVVNETSGVLNSATSVLIQSVIVKDDRTTKRMTYGYNVNTNAVSTTLQSLEVDGAKISPFKINAVGNEIKNVVLDKSSVTSGQITLSAGTSTKILNPNIKALYRGIVGYNVPIIEFIPLNTAARSLLTKPLTYTVSVINGFTIQHPTATGNEKFLYKVNGFALSSINIASNSVYDSFNRPDNTGTLGLTDTEHTWSVSGTWGISSGQAYSTSTSGTIRAVVNPTISDAIVEVTYAVVTNDQRLIFRYSDASNEWYVTTNTDNSTYDLFKRVAGVITKIASINSTPSNGDKISVTLIGTSIKVYVNDVLKLDINDSFNATATWYGMRINEYGSVSRFDDFRVDEII